MMPQFRFIYDGIASMLGVLSILDRRRLKLSELVESYPRYSMIKGELPLETKRMPQMLLDLEKRYPDAKRNVVDGLRLDWPSRWAHVRVSQTEPIVRIICEQRGAPPTALCDEVCDFVRGYVT